MSQYRGAGRPGLTETAAMARCKTDLIKGIAAAKTFAELATAAQGMFILEPGSVERERAYLELFLMTEKFNGNRCKKEFKIVPEDLAEPGASRGSGGGSMAWY